MLQACVYYINEYRLFKEIVDQLIKAGVNLGVIGCPILNICIQYNKFDFAKYLLINGAPVVHKTSSFYYEFCFYNGNLNNSNIRPSRMQKNK